jgi:hypothetical protein
MLLVENESVPVILPRLARSMEVWRLASTVYTTRRAIAEILHAVRFHAPGRSGSCACQRVPEKAGRLRGLADFGGARAQMTFSAFEPLELPSRPRQKQRSSFAVARRPRAAVHRRQRDLQIALAASRDRRANHVPAHGSRQDLAISAKSRSPGRYPDKKAAVGAKADQAKRSRASKAKAAAGPRTLSASGR